MKAQNTIKRVFKIPFPWFFVAVFFAFLFFGLLFYVLHLRQRFTELVSSKQALTVRHGKIAEQWIPFSNDFPVPPERFRFLGHPVDGIAFLDDKILFVEFKIGKSGLSGKQKKIRDLVESKKVGFVEYRVK